MPQISHFNKFENNPKQNISEGVVEMQTGLYHVLRNKDSFTILMKNFILKKKVNSLF